MTHFGITLAKHAQDLYCNNLNVDERRKNINRKICHTQRIKNLTLEII